MPGKRSYVSAVPGTLTQAQLRRQERDRPFLTQPPPPPPLDVPGRRPLWADVAVDHGEPPLSGLYLHSICSANSFMHETIFRRPARAPTPPPPFECGDEWREEDLVVLSDSVVLDKDVSLPIKVFLAEQFYIGDCEEELMITTDPLQPACAGGEIFCFEDAPTICKEYSLPVPLCLEALTSCSGSLVSLVSPTMDSFGLTLRRFIRVNGGNMKGTISFGLRLRNWLRDQPSINGGLSGEESGFILDQPSRKGDLSGEENFTATEPLYQKLGDSAIRESNVPAEAEPLYQKAAEPLYQNGRIGGIFDDKDAGECPTEGALSFNSNACNMVDSSPDPNNYNADSFNSNACLVVEKLQISAEYFEFREFVNQNETEVNPLAQISTENHSVQIACEKLETLLTEYIFDLAKEFLKTNRQTFFLSFARACPPPLGFVALSRFP